MIPRYSLANALLLQKKRRDDLLGFIRIDKAAVD
jgi:hypothetical protein